MRTPQGRCSCEPVTAPIAFMSSSRPATKTALYSGRLWGRRRCEMPQCYCFRGRRYFDERGTHSDWEPTADHYPRLKMHGGHLTPDNVRLAHRLCNRRDYEWRTRINAMLGKRMSLEKIADQL